MNGATTQRPVSSRQNNKLLLGIQKVANDVILNLEQYRYNCIVEVI